MGKTGQTFILSTLERLFYRWGHLVASRPWPVIATAFTITSLCSLGFLLFRVQYATDELWIPSTSPFKSNKEWRNLHFRRNTRYENILFKGENVLSPEGLRQMYAVYSRIVTFKVSGTTFYDMCYKVPIEELFYHGKNPRGIKNKKSTSETTTTTTETVSVVTEPSDDDYDGFDIWDDYFDSSDADANNNSTESPISVDFQATNSTKKDIYCDLVTTIDKRCAVTSLLEIWDYDGDIISNLTTQDILDAVNTLDESPWFFSKRDYLDDLSGVTRNATGHVVAAKTAWIQILLEVPEDAKNVAPGGIGFEFEVADENSLAMEQHMIDVCREENGLRGFEVYPFTARSFNDVSFQTIFFDVWKMLGGYVIMFFYTVIMLGRLNKKEVRLYLSALGIFACILGLGASFGLMFLFGLEYNQTHNILPFIAIGIGIDDMFVIMACWYNLHKDSTLATLSLPERMGLAMKHAGVSVTVTSITDILAFGIGACTIMPGLSSFCVTAAICIGFIFLLQISWTVAWLSLDQEGWRQNPTWWVKLSRVLIATLEQARIERNQHGVIPCITVPDTEETEDSTLASLGDRSINFYSDLFKYWPFKVMVLLISGGLLSAGVYGSVNIVQRFDPNRMLPGDSYLSQWINIQQEYYAGHGFAVWVMTGTLELEDLPKLDQMVENFYNISKDGPGKILREVDTWWTPFKKFINEKKNSSIDQINSTLMFHTHLSDFLFDVSNAKQQFNFKFDGVLDCNKPTPAITATQMKVQYGMSSSLPAPSEYLPAKATVDKIIEDANFSSKSFATSPIYQAWETDSIISLELWRNLGLALLAVGAVALVMLGNFYLCLMVMACVMLTLVDVVGTLHFWDVTIDVISCVNIILATGLCVDYSVHLAHAFSIAQGSRFEKTKKALTDLGPAVANAGMTTFLAVIILPFSSSHVFLTFFKIFGLTVCYGVFHGLVFLPVLLSTIGPSSPQLEQQTLENPNNNQPKSVISSSSDQSSKPSGTINPVFSTL